jgi:acyl-CoA reductase-like NAD-dependent aldehyde dehydrogenase
MIIILQTGLGLEQEGGFMVAQTTTSHVQLHTITDYIDGQMHTPTGKLPAAVGNPNTHEPLQQQRTTSPALVDQAIAAAEDAHTRGEWRSLSGEDRAQILEEIADDLEEQLDDLAAVEALTTGIVIKQTRALARLVPLSFRHAARYVRQVAHPTALSNSVQVQRIPWGPAAILPSWSSGAVATAHKVASALAAGAPVILKPSEWAPHAADIVALAIARRELPAGVFQLVHGGAEVVAQLVADARVQAVAFNGDRRTGLALAQACAQQLKPVHLELSGINPLIVCQDADLDEAVEGIVTALTLLNGQWPWGLGRLLVHAQQYHALLCKLLDRLETVRLGDSLDPESDMGPLIHAEHLETVRAQVQMLMSCGGVFHESGHLPNLPGYFMKPALITNCPPGDALQEIMGPVATVHLFKHDAEARQLANQPDALWTAYLYTADVERAYAFARELRATSVSINAVSLYGLHPNAPRAAWGQSGLGEAGVAESIRFFGGTRAIGIAHS